MGNDIFKDVFRNAVFLQTIFDAIPSQLFVVDSDVQTFHLNSAASRTLGISREQVLMVRGGEILKCIHSFETPGGCGNAPSCADCIIRRSVTGAIAGNKVYRKDTDMELIRDGKETKVHMLVTASPFEFEGQKLSILVLEDITEIKLIEEALRKSENRLRKITSVLGEGVYVLDRTGRLTFMNPEAEKLLGWSEQELLGKNMHETVHYKRADGTHLPAEECPVMMTIRSGKTYRVAEDNFISSDGRMLPVALVSTPITEEGEIIGSVAAFHDITERKRIQEAMKYSNELLEKQATTDVLTGIYNRLKFNDLLLVEMQRAVRNGMPLSLIMMDIDHFKLINDTCGHQVGDNVLREIAAIVTKTIRPYDIFARWGGEEFMILSPYNGMEKTRQLAERLRAGIQRSGFAGACAVTCSFGVAEFRQGEDDNSFTRHADAALYIAKKRGRNRVEVAQE